MKFCFYIHSLNGGGAERVTAILASHFVNHGYEVSVLTMAEVESDFYTLDPRVRRMSLSLAGGSLGLAKLAANLRRWRALRRIFKEEQPDVVVAMMTTSIVLAILAAVGLPVRVYGSERNYPAHQRIGRIWAILRRLVYRFARGHVAQTNEVAAWLKQYTGAHNVHVVPNPVVWPIPSCAPIVYPLSLVPSDRKIILAVGSKPEQKGFDLLLKAFAGLMPSYPDWDLVILGVDELLVLPLAEDEAVTKRLHLPGRVGNVSDWYQRSDVFVLSSRYEGFPNVLIEAMASGCPCVAFDCDTGPRDMIENRVNGILVPPEDIDELKVAMKNLMSDPDLRSQLGKQACSVRETFSELRVVTLWQEVLQ